MHDEENPIGLILVADCARKYCSEIAAINETVSRLNLSVRFFFAHLLEKPYACQFRNISSQYLFIHVVEWRDNIIWIRAGGIMAVDEFIAVFALLLLLYAEAVQGEESTSRNFISWWSCE